MEGPSIPRLHYLFSQLHPVLFYKFQAIGVASPSGCPSSPYSHFQSNSKFFIVEHFVLWHGRVMTNLRRALREVAITK